MVKGVNKKIIEINDTGNEIFEKVVLYIKPKYSLLSNKELKKEAEEILRNYNVEDFNYKAEERGSKRLILFLFCACLVAVGAAVLALIF